MTLASALGNYILYQLELFSSESFDIKPASLSSTLETAARP